MVISVAERLDRIERTLGIQEDNEEASIHLILDMSGSMADIGQTEVLGSANKYIKDIKKTSPDAFLEVIVFDTEYEKVIDLEKVSDVRLLTKDDYEPRGGTALYDAIGKTITDSQGGRHLFVILTDGYENSSREFKHPDRLKRLIKKTERAGNQFIFLGANQDAILAAGRVGIAMASSGTWVSSPAGYYGATTTASTATTDWVASNTSVNLKESVTKANTGDVVQTTP